MYGIHLSRTGDQQTVEFGLKRPLAFRDLADVYRLVLGDIGESDLPRRYESDPEWGTLTLGNGADLELTLRRDGGDWILYIRDIENGGSTSAGVDSLEAAFDFLADWAYEGLRSAGEWDD